MKSLNIVTKVGQLTTPDSIHDRRSSIECSRASSKQRYEKGPCRLSRVKTMVKEKEGFIVYAAGVRGSVALADAESTGQGFLRASCSFTKQPLGPLTHPVGRVSNVCAEWRTQMVRKRTADDNNAVFRVDLEDAQVLDSVLLSSHATSHLLSRQDSATASLRCTGTTHGSVGQTVTVTGRLTTEAPSLHATSETHAPAVCSGVDKLTLLEPIGIDDGANIEQSALVPDPEFLQVSLEGDGVGCKVTSLRPRDVARLFGPRSHLYGPVAVLGARLVRHDLYAVELQDGAGHTSGGFRVIESRHSLFGRKCSGAGRQRVCFSLQRRRLGRGKDRKVHAHVEAIRPDLVE